MYSVKVAEKSREGETEIRRHPKFTEKLCNSITINNKVFDDQQKIFLEVTALYPDKHFIGTIVKDHVEYKSYKQIHQLAEKLGSGIINMNLAPPVKEYQNQE